MIVETTEETRRVFDCVRKNAKANPQIYNGRYAQKNKKDAYIAFLESRLLSAFDEIKQIKKGA